MSFPAVRCGFVRMDCLSSTAISIVTSPSRGSGVLSQRILIAVCAGLSFCAAQTINIRGTAKDITGAPISGATVKLEAANISTMTGPDGGFTLAGTLSGISPKNSLNSLARSPIALHQGRLRISLWEKTPVAIRVRNAGGRQIHGSDGTYAAGTHILPSFSTGTGMSFCSISIGTRSYAFQFPPFGSNSVAVQSESRNPGGGPLAKGGGASGVFGDVISSRKEGQINFRDSVKTFDTTGIVITMIPNAGNVTDADGNVYQSVQLGNQVWTVENLKTTKYNDGTSIPHVTDNAEWGSLTTGAYCFYDNDVANKDKLGAMYHWEAVRTGKLAPVGWHVPTEEEWLNLETYLIANGYNADGKTTGNKVAKSLAAKTDWIASPAAGSVGNEPGKNNATGFSALPGGRRYDIVQFGNPFIAKDSTTFWWSITPDLGGGTNSAICFSLYNYSGSLKENYHHLGYAMSIRLVRDY